jgi:hypothetical protein
MTILVPTMMFGWIPFVLALFVCLRPVRAVVVAYIGALLFLPMATYPIAGLPDYTKMVASSLGVLLGTMLFCPSRLQAFRPCWLDIPMVVWCLAPFPSSVTSGLGAYDGLSEAFSQTVTWGLPYAIGRLYLVDLGDLREVAIGILIGGLVYVPLCLWELRMAPTLHYYVYGFQQHKFSQHMRWGGYRPKVFMQHGLMLAMWMMAASLMSIWLWRIGQLKRMWNVPMWAISGILVATTALCKSLNSIALMLVTVSVLYMTKWTRTRVPLAIVMVLPHAYMICRVTGIWQAHGMVRWTAEVAGDERANSLKDRLEQEDLFSARAWRRPLFGWTAKLMFPKDETTDRRLTRGIDSLWIIALGGTGLVGLISWAASMALAPLLLLWHSRASIWLSPGAGVPGALALLVTVHFIDCLFNGMVNPVYVLVVGGLSGFVSHSTPALAKSEAWSNRVRSGITVGALPLRNRVGGS